MTGMDKGFIAALFLALGLLLTAGGAVWFILAGKWAAMKRRSELARELMEQLGRGGDSASYYNYILARMASLVMAASYAFYLYDEQENTYRLRAVRAPDDSTADIGPSYTGLVPYKREKGYQPPASMDPKLAGEKPGMLRHMDISVLAVPLQGGKGLLLAGPVHKVRRDTMLTMGYMAELLPGVIETLLQLETPGQGQEQPEWLFQDRYAGLKQAHTEAAASTDVTVNDLPLLADHPELMADMFLNLFDKRFNASAAVLIREEQGGLGGVGITISAFLGIKKELLLRLQNDRKTSGLFDIAPAGRTLVIRREDARYLELPDVLQAAGRNSYILLKTSLKGKEALLLVAKQQRYGMAAGGVEADGEAKALEALERVVQIAGSILEQQAQAGTTAFTAQAARIELLKRLALLIDHLSPYTVGYSQMLSRYSAIAARELSLDKRMVQQVALAANLAHIGLLGLSDDIMLKDGNYTDREYERMKRHSELGAVFVERLTADKEVAQMIRHHHERMDGWGYPNGLMGGSIPIGARIIAVVQCFLAKIGDRGYREAVEFEKALELLRSSAGTELDGSIVEALAGWFRKKRSSPAVAGRALGPCWEMNCVPSSICSICPAYRNTEKNCWEFDSNQCSAHGKTCGTCYVYTEAKSRAASSGLPGIAKNDNRP